MGDPVQREEQCVRVGQAVEPIEGERVLAVGLAADATGVPGHDADEQQDRRPLEREPKIVSLFNSRKSSSISARAIQQVARLSATP